MSLVTRNAPKLTLAGARAVLAAAERRAARSIAHGYRGG